MVEIIEIVGKRSDENLDPQNNPHAILEEDAEDERIARKYGLAKDQLQWLRHTTEELKDPTNDEIRRVVNESIVELENNPLHVKTVKMLKSLRDIIQKW